MPKPPQYTPDFVRTINDIQRRLSIVERSETGSQAHGFYKRDARTGNTGALSPGVGSTVDIDFSLPDCELSETRTYLVGMHAQFQHGGIDTTAGWRILLSETDADGVVVQRGQLWRKSRLFAGEVDTISVAMPYWPTTGRFGLRPRLHQDAGAAATFTLNATASPIMYRWFWIEDVGPRI